MIRRQRGLGGKPVTSLPSGISPKSLRQAHGPLVAMQGQSYSSIVSICLLDPRGLPSHLSRAVEGQCTLAARLPHCTAALLSSHPAHRVALALLPPRVRT